MTERRKDLLANLQSLHDSKVRAFAEVDAAEMRKKLKHYEKKRDERALNMSGMELRSLTSQAPMYLCGPTIVVVVGARRSHNDMMESLQQVPNLTCMVVDEAMMEPAALLAGANTIWLLPTEEKLDSFMDPLNVRVPSRKLM